MKYRIDIVAAALTGLSNECARIATSKGFDLSQHATQIALIATETAEALEHVTATGMGETDFFIDIIRRRSESFEFYRKHAVNYADASAVTDEDALYEELADSVIRVFSYAGGNGNAVKLARHIIAKMEKNALRPAKHGKGF